MLQRPTAAVSYSFSNAPSGSASKSNTGGGGRPRKPWRSRLCAVVTVLADHRGEIMKRLTSAELFAPPKSARKTKARLERGKLGGGAARERAAGARAQQAAPTS